MKLPFVKRSVYEDLKEKLDVALERINKTELVIKYVHDVVKDWHLKKVGNLRAISTIANLFKPKDSKGR